VLLRTGARCRDQAGGTAHEPAAAGVLFPSTGIELRPEWSALLMSVSSIIVATNAVLLKRVERELPGGAAS
jgi:P-type Cu2+ transporter